MTINNEFLSSVEQASQLLDDLTRLLDKERGALESSDARQSQALLPEKTGILQSLEQNATQRGQLLSSHGFEPSHDGVQSYFEQLSATDLRAIEPKWEALITQMQICKNANAVNGKIIHRSRQQIDALMSLLQGNRDGGKIYNHSGTARPVSSPGTLAKA